MPVDHLAALKGRHRGNCGLPRLQIRCVLALVVGEARAETLEREARLPNRVIPRDQLVEARLADDQDHLALQPSAHRAAHHSFLAAAAPSSNVFSSSGETLS